MDSLNRQQTIEAAATGPSSTTLSPRPQGKRVTLVDENNTITSGSCT